MTNCQKNLENFPPKRLKLFAIRAKKISSSRVKKYSGQGRVSPLFTAGQKYAQVRARLYFIC